MTVHWRQPGITRGIEPGGQIACDHPSRSEVPGDVETDDGAIVGRVVAGDIEAYEVLVRRYYDRCLRYAYRMLGNDADARDVVQDAFVRAYRGLRSYRDDGRFDAWLFRILLNRCRTASARRARRSQVFVPLEPLGVEAAAEMGTDTVLIREEIGKALGALQPSAREAFLLKYVEDMTYEQMADLTGDSVSALKMRVKRARDELRFRLDEGRHD
jgi:RNA polymerase sigma-70 factor, ECF subfamily